MHEPAHLFFVYILAKRSRVIEIGITDDLAAPLTHHKAATFNEFIPKKPGYELVYVEPFHSSSDAAARETYLERLGRSRVLKLIQSENPRWEDLAEWEIADTFGGFTPSDSQPKRTRQRRTTLRWKARAPSRHHLQPTLPRNIFRG